MTALRHLVLGLGLLVACVAPTASAGLLPGETFMHPQDMSDDERANNSRFGDAVAVDGRYAVIGAPHMDGAAGGNQGAAYVYEGDGFSWIHQATLVPVDAEPNTLFGSAVAISGDTILVGSRWDTIDGRSRAGSVYVFERNGNAWTQTQKLTPPGSLSNVFFGSAIAIVGDQAVIGAFAAQTFGAATGAVYPYARDAGMWVAQPEVAPTSHQPNQYFGYSVALAGDALLVGAPLHPGFDGSPAVGRAELFRRNGPNWESYGWMDGPGNAQDWFGASVAMTSEFAAVGAPYAPTQLGMDAGVVALFDLQGGALAPIGMLQAAPAQNGTWFGFALAMVGKSLYVGQPGPLAPQQRLLRYGYENFQWTFRDAFMPNTPFGAFGYSVAASTRAVLVGAPDAFEQTTSHQAGRTHSYRRTATVTTNAGPGGKLLPFGPIVLPAGEPFSMFAAADPGYRVATLSGCDGMRSGPTLLIPQLSDDCTAVATFANDAPTVVEVTASDTTVDEGDSVTITITATDDTDTAEQLRYAFDCNGDGTFEIAPQAANQAMCTLASSGTIVVAARVIDRANASASGTVSIAVASTAPVVTTFTAPATAVEDATVDVGFNGTASPGRTIARFEVDCDIVGATFDIDRMLLGAGAAVCPGYVTGGTHTVGVRAVDNTNAVSAIVTRNIDVTPINDKPTFTMPAQVDLGPGGTGTKTVSGFITDVVLGPSDESDQTVLGYSVVEVDDFADIVSNASIDAAGNLSVTLTGAGGYAQLGVTLTDSGGTPGNPQSDVQQLIVINEFGTDLRVAVTDSATTVVPGATVTYQIVLRNAGPNPATQTRLQAAAPAGLENVGYACQPVNAECSAFGNGAIDFKVDLAVDATVTVEMYGTVTAAPGAFVTATASVTPREGLLEAAPSDNTASDVDAVATIGIFKADFEDGSGSVEALWR